MFYPPLIHHSYLHLPTNLNLYPFLFLSHLVANSLDKNKSKTRQNNYKNPNSNNKNKQSRIEQNKKKCQRKSTWMTEIGRDTHTHVHRNYLKTKLETVVYKPKTWKLKKIPIENVKKQKKSPNIWILFVLGIYCLTLFPSEVWFVSLLTLLEKTDIS